MLLEERLAALDEASSLLRCERYIAGRIHDELGAEKQLEDPAHYASQAACALERAIVLDRNEPVWASVPVVARILTEMEEVANAFPDYEPYKSQKDALLRDGQRRLAALTPKQLLGTFKKRCAVCRGVLRGERGLASWENGAEVLEATLHHPAWQPRLATLARGGGVLGERLFHLDGLTELSIEHHDISATSAYGLDGVFFLAGAAATAEELRAEIALMQAEAAAVESATAAAGAAGHARRAAAVARAAHARERAQQQAAALGAAATAASAAAAGRSLWTNWNASSRIRQPVSWRQP